MPNFKIAVFGAGNVGGALARIWSGKGHQVVYGLPDPGKADTGGIPAMSNREAAATADVVVLCVPWAKAEESIQAAGDLAGKVVVDCLNPLEPDLSGLAIGCKTSAAEMVAGWAKGARVVKAFNTIGAVNFGNAQFGAQRADGFYCGDDAAAKDLVKGLIDEAGWTPSM